MWTTTTSLETGRGERQLAGDLLIRHSRERKIMKCADNEQLRTELGVGGVDGTVGDFTSQLTAQHTDYG